MRAEGGNCGSGAQCIARYQCTAPAKKQKAQYRARDTADNPLNRLLSENFGAFEAWLKSPPVDRKPRPNRAVLGAMEKYAECGNLRYGAVRYRCPDCGRDLFVAFSCKRRGFCPSCDAKRSAIVTESALCRLLPGAPYRQWVLVVPKRLRYYINRSPLLTGKLSELLAREINRYLTNKAAGVPAQLHFIQRFGGALNLHVHVHAMASDGVFNLNPGLRNTVEFTPVPPPDEAELRMMIERLRRSLLRAVVRHGGLPPEAAEDMRNWENSGFSLHEKVGISAQDRRGLRNLLEYCSRPALSVRRLTYLAKLNKVIYRGEKHGILGGALEMSALEFLRRWAILMPPPRKNLVHYYGALAPRSPLRPLVVAETLKETNLAVAKEKSEALKKRAKSWAACLARVFEVLPLICPACRTEMNPVAVIMEDKALVRLLTHLGLPAEFPVFAAGPKKAQYCNSPPDPDCQLDPRVDQYDAIDAPSPED